MGRRGPACTLTAALALSLLVSACGSATGPGVATLGATSKTGPSDRSAPGTSAAAYASCMTAHGVAMAPPGNRHGLTILGSAAPGSSLFGAAERACRKLEPAGGPASLTPAQQALAARALARFAACMRDHGVPGFPDPDGEGTFPEARIEALDAGSPFFARALGACDRLYPTRTAPGIAFPGGEHT
jgi:hypothetical protein